METNIYKCEKCNKEFDFNTYCKLCHYDDKLMKTFVESVLMISYEKFYQKKKQIYLYAEISKILKHTMIDLEYEIALLQKNR